MTSQVEELRTDMATQIGEDQKKVRLANADWTMFIQQGVLVDLHIGRYRAQVSMTLEDLGIQPATQAERDALERTINLGRRFVLPKETVMRAQEIEGRSRQWLLKNAFKTTWGYFIHVSRYQQWRTRQLEIEQEYMDLADEIERTYPQLMGIVTRDYVTLGLQVWDRLLPQRPDKDTVTVDTKRAWVGNFVRRALRSVPSAKEIQRSFSMQYGVKFIPPQAAIAADRMAAEETIMAARERARLSAEAAMQADLQITQAREEVGGIQDFVADVQGQIRGAIYDSVVSALETLRDGKEGRMPRGSTVRIKNMVDMVQELVFWDDPDLQSKVSNLADLCETTAAQRDVDEVERALRELGAESRLVLLDLERIPQRSGRAMGIPDTEPELLSMLGKRQQPVLSETGETGDDGLRVSRRQPVYLEG